jgi:hypothetical protein
MKCPLDSRAIFNKFGTLVKIWYNNINLCSLINKK